MARPRRPDEHQLEAISRLKFRERCPPAWVVRDLDPDYGLDMLVDIFEDGEATGRSFYVQMRSTREADLRRALAVRLTAEQAALYRSLDLPVLIALYVASVDRVFVRWFHTYDPHYEARSSEDVRQTFTFRLHESHEWVDSAAEDLSRVTVAFRRFRSPWLVLPLRFYVAQTDDRIHGASLVEHVNSLRRVAVDLGDAVVFQAGAPPAGEPTLTIDRTAVSVNLGGVSSTTGHYEPDLSDERWTEVFPYDVLTLIALTFDQIGQTALAAGIAARGAHGARLLAVDPEVALRLAGAFSRSQSFAEAIDLAEVLDESADPDLRAVGDIILTACRAYEMPMRDRNAYIAALERRIQRRLERYELGAAAATQYTLGNFLHTSMHDARGALPYYRRAAESDPTYRLRGYFYRDLGGILFELGRPLFAAEAYRRAIDLGDRPEIRARFADALLFAGQLREAQEAFEQYVQQEADAPPEWRLKSFIVPTLREAGGDSIRRQPEDAIELVRSADLVSPLDGEAIARLRAALEADVLCGIAWFYLGRDAADRDVDTALLSCLIGSLTTLKGEPAAWATTALLAWTSASHQRLVDDILWTGYHYVGAALASVFSERPDDWPVEDWLRFHKALEGAATAEETRRLAEQGFEMRFNVPEEQQTVTFDIRRASPE